MTNIYRISTPVGTCEHDIEWITVQVLVGNYYDADCAAVNMNIPCYFIEVFDGPSNKWMSA